MNKKPSKRRKPSASHGPRPAVIGRTSRDKTLDVLNDPGLMRQIEKSQAFYAAGGKGLPFKNVFGEPLRPARRGRR